ncbi:hypothetical protein [Kocuria sp. HSID16901]|uniref:hypothetical protein n=1 Tax=Kocuria sp. HSID16901 TaxID=2419505 RepID=UPI000F8705FE|nr:hypothetical protein [Kocuria sp. HSID16901]RUQ19835.1 hypothetical protein D8M21_10970 [Kocuria sp. HSID16901]
MRLFAPIKNRLEKIESDLNAARPDQAPEFDEQDNRNKARNAALARGVPERLLDDKEPALTDQQMQEWAEALTRSLEAKTVRRYITDLHQQLTAARTFPIVTKTQVRRVPRLETQLHILGLAEYKMNRGE